MSGNTGSGHPLPASGEARHDQIPESLEKEKGDGDDASQVAAPSPRPVNPDGKPYGEFQRDQRQHQDRGQGDIEADRD